MRQEEGLRCEAQPWVIQRGVGSSVLVIAEDVTTSDTVRGQDMVAGRSPVATPIHEISTLGFILVTATKRGIDAPETVPELGQGSPGRKDCLIRADTRDMPVIEKRDWT